MKKTIIIACMLLGSMAGMAQTEKKYVLPKMSRQELAKLKNIIRNSAVNDADAVEDEKKISEINKLLRSKLDSTNIGGVNESDVIKLLETNAYGYENFVRSRKDYNSFMRLLDIIQKADPKLDVLRNRQSGFFMHQGNVEDMLDELKKWRNRK